MVSNSYTATNVGKLCPSIWDEECRWHNAWQKQLQAFGTRRDHIRSFPFKEIAPTPSFRVTTPSDLVISYVPSSPFPDLSWLSLDSVRCGIDSILWRMARSIASNTLRYPRSLIWSISARLERRCLVKFNDRQQ